MISELMDLKILHCVVELVMLVRETKAYLIG